MIISKTPFRISFCGGGTDLPSYYRKNGGCVVSTSIDKFVYITMEKSFHRNLTTIKYSSVETVDDIEFIKHPIFREVFQKYMVKGIEVGSISDIPAGTGLGSSSAFTVGLENVIRTYKKKKVSKEILAAEACDIELNRLGESIGKQDQYASAYGNLNFISFNKDDSVDVEPIRLTAEDKKRLSDNLMMFYLGGTRKASRIIKSYDNSNPELDLKKDKMADLARKLRDELNKGDIESLGRIMNEGWKIKKTLSNGVSSPLIDDAYDLAMNNGAVGGKLLGAGGSGFILLYVDKDNQKNVLNALSDFRNLEFNLYEKGSEIVYNDY